MKGWIKLVLLLYLFVLAIEIIKTTSLSLAPDIGGFLVNGTSPVRALATGWFTTAVVQSSGAIGSVTAALVGNEILNLEIAVFILMGAALGTTVTALLISIITISQKRRDFRHGFEIGLAYSLYIAMVVVIVFFLELFFGVFSKASFFLASTIGNSIPLGKAVNILDIATGPIVDALMENVGGILAFIFGIAVLIFVLRYVSKVVVDVLGGEEKARNFINKHFNSKIKIYFIGVLLTAITFSSSITISLLVPLAVGRLINLKKAIPFILGAASGTSTDIFLASIVIGNANALATFIAFFLFSVTGAIIFLPNTKFIHRITKYTSKKLIHISRRKALYFLFGFILIPLLIILIF